VRISIRPATEADIPVFVSHQSDPEAAAMAAFIAPASVEERSARWRDVLAQPQNRNRAIVGDESVIGFIAAFTREDDREVTYWVAREHWGHGVATRALSLLLQEETRRPLVGRAAADNVASQMVLRKCGFTMIGRDRGFAPARGVEIEEVIYRLDAVHVRAATREDIEEMHRVRMSVRENRLGEFTRVTPRDYEILIDGRGRAWVAEMAGRIVGFAVADLARANVWALFVEPEFERRGIGRRLHDEMVAWLFAASVEMIWLTTGRGTRAEAFYRAAGWRDAGNQAGEARYELTQGTWKGALSQPPEVA
jgi:RimJ/RimL family protein N-acetyltransferase